MLAAKAKLRAAEELRKLLLNEEIYDFSRQPLKEGEEIYFPITKKIGGITIVEKDLQEVKKEITVHEILERQMPKEFLAEVPRAMDFIGDIVIIELPESLKKYYQTIGNALLQAHKSLKVVCRKAGFYGGKYRTRKLEVIAGENRKETMCQENGVRLKLNVETCYFSPRLSNDRIRIANLVKPKESVLVMFSGVGPYPLVISKNSRAKEVYGIEINPEAHRYALFNAELNHLKNVFLYKGDVNKALPKLRKKFDRVLLPLPKDAAEFLPLAVKYAKKNAVIHLYNFEKEEGIHGLPKKIKGKVKKCRILRIVKCGQYSPGKYRVCVDIKRL